MSGFYDLNRKGKRQTCCIEREKTLDEKRDIEVDKDKVEQVLREIFDRYGKDIVRDRYRFESAVQDLLSRQAYAGEWMIFQHVFHSTALWPLVGESPIQKGTAEKAVRQLEQESRMREEDAKFIVRSVIAACGQNPNILSCAGAQEGSSNSREQENQKEKENKEKQENQKEKERREVCEALCKIKGKDFSWFYSRGKVSVFDDGTIEFIKTKGKYRRMEIQLQDIDKVSSYILFRLTAFLMIAGWAALTYMMYINGEFYVGYVGNDFVLIWELFSLYWVPIWGACVIVPVRHMRLVTARDLGGYRHVYRLYFYDRASKKYVLSQIRGMQYKGKR